MTVSSPTGPDPRRILVLGATGQVGWELLRTLAPLGEVLGASRDGRFGIRADLAKVVELGPLLDRTRPDLVVNAAAYTQVDQAESEPDLATRINAEAVAELGRLAGARGLPVIHYSTDFVFPGRATHPYREDDAPNPLNVYGKSKLAGETALLESDAPAVVLRTSWVYGARGHNFLRTMLRLSRERHELRVVDDQIGAPTWSRMIAAATAHIAARLLHSPPDESTGLYHLSAAGHTSWYGFARAILDARGGECELHPIPSDDYPTPALRPAWSVLDNSRLTRTFGLRLPDWRHSLGQCLQDMQGE